MDIPRIAYGDEAVDDLISQTLAGQRVSAANSEKAAVIRCAKQFKKRQLVGLVIPVAAPPDDVIVKQRIEPGDDVVACRFQEASAEISSASWRFK